MEENEKIEKAENEKNDKIDSENIEEPQEQNIKGPEEQNIEEPQKQKEELKEFEEKKPVIAPKQKKRFLFRKIPIYLWLLFIILGLVGGIALNIYNNPPPPTIIIPPIVNGDDEPMEIELIYSDECPFCSKHNTIFDVFALNNIKFTVKEIEASSTLGKEKIAAFNPNILPAAIVPVKGLNKFSKIKEAMEEESIKKINGFFVVPERNRVEMKIYSRMYLEPPHPTDCNAENPTIDILLFDDPYGEIMIKTQPVLYQALNDLNDLAKVKFEYIPLQFTTLNEDTDREEKKLTGNYLACASLENKFNEGFSRTLSIYCGGEDLTLTPFNIQTCQLAPHYGTPLSLEEIEAATIEMMGIQPRLFDTCLLYIDEANRSSIQRVKDYSLPRPGTAIVDCKYNVPYQAIDEAVCTINPELELCNNDE